MCDSNDGGHSRPSRKKENAYDVIEIGEAPNEKGPANGRPLPDNLGVETPRKPSSNPEFALLDVQVNSELEEKCYG